MLTLDTVSLRTVIQIVDLSSVVMPASQVNADTRDVDDWYHESDEWAHNGGRGPAQSPVNLSIDSHHGVDNSVRKRKNGAAARSLVGAGRGPVSVEDAAFWGSEEAAAAQSALVQTNRSRTRKPRTPNDDRVGKQRGGKGIKPGSRTGAIVDRGGKASSVGGAGTESRVHKPMRRAQPWRDES
jgi:hypothetical protein